MAPKPRVEFAGMMASEYGRGEEKKCENRRSVRKASGITTRRRLTSIISDFWELRHAPRLLQRQ